MKKAILILCILFTCTLAGISPPAKVLTIEKANGINPYLRLFDAIATVETGKDPSAYNEREQATGIVQIRPIKLIDYNQATGQQLKITDMYDISLSKQVFLWHCMKYHSDLETIARKWNGSGEKTKEYWQRVSAILD